jgi:hypothetical protein
MKPLNAKALVTTAILLALTVVFQNLRLLAGINPVTTYIIGTLVNTCLIVSVIMVNIPSGLTIAAAAPLIALAQGHVIAPMLPWAVIGNASLVLAYGLIVGHRALLLPRFAIAGVIAAIVKYAVMALGQALVLSNGGQAFGAALTLAFAERQIQQLVTALIAAVLVRGALLNTLKKAVH